MPEKYILNLYHPNKLCFHSVNALWFVFLQLYQELLLRKEIRALENNINNLINHINSHKVESKDIESTLEQKHREYNGLCKQRDDLQERRKWVTWWNTCCIWVYALRKKKWLQIIMEGGIQFEIWNLLSYRRSCEGTEELGSRNAWGMENILPFLTLSFVHITDLSLNFFTFFVFSSGSI